ncbi:RNA-directed DNA polymerase, eukaryota [Tanacetum coccineum]
METTWKSMNVVEPNGLIRLKKKLQLLKNTIKVWSKEARTRLHEKKINIQHKLSDVDKTIDQGTSNVEVINNKTNLLKELQELYSTDAIEISQKAKIRWSIEGDENTKYFHGILNKKRSQLAIRGTLVNGDWISDHDRIIDQGVFQAVTQFFVNGHIPRGCNSSYIALIPKIQDAKLVKDFRPISLIGSVYKIITKILANRLCLVLPCLISEVQSAFVSNRQILNGSFILNELLSWCKFKKKSAMIFKVDFEKAFDSVKWDYLIDSLKAFGFGQKWCKWINGLKINFHKSKLMVVGVNSDEVERAASLVGCSTFSSPFKYLGVKVGGNMSRINSWEEVITKVSTRLSKWKLKSLSIGGRLTLLKSVLTSIPLYHMSIFKVPMVIHGNQGALDSCKSTSRRSPWLDIIQDLHSLKTKGDDVFKSIYPRLYALEECKSICVADKLRHPSLVYSFRRLPRGGVEEDQLDMLRFRMTDVILPNMSDRWI